MKYKEPGIYDKYIPYLSVCTERERRMILLKNKGISFAKVWKALGGVSKQCIHEAIMLALDKIEKVKNHLDEMGKKHLQ